MDGRPELRIYWDRILIELPKSVELNRCQDNVFLLRRDITFLFAHKKLHQSLETVMSSSTIT